MYVDYSPVLASGLSWAVPTFYTDFNMYPTTGVEEITTLDAMVYP